MHERPASARYAGQARDPILLEMWQRAASQPYTITIKGRSQFQRLRQQLYRLRLILQADNDPLYHNLRTLSITSEKIDTNLFKLTIGPADADLREQLFAAGLTGDAQSPAATDPFDTSYLDNIKPKDKP